MGIILDGNNLSPRTN